MQGQGRARAGQGQGRAGQDQCVGEGGEGRGGRVGGWGRGGECRAACRLQAMHLTNCCSDSMMCRTQGCIAIKWHTSKGLDVLRCPVPSLANMSSAFPAL